MKSLVTRFFHLREFDPQKGEWGAWEIVARYEQISILNPLVEAPSVRARYYARAWTAVLNGYLTEHIKWSLLLQWTTWAETERAILTRIQVVF